MPEDFSLRSASLGSDAFVVTVEGELDIATAPGLRDELTRIADDGGRDVIVDLLAVPFLDSVALGLLVETSKRMKGRGGSLRMVCDDRRIVRIIEITGLDRVLRRHSSLREALESLDAYPAPKAAAR